MKILVLLLLLLSAGVARADTINVSATACDSCFGAPQPSVNLQAQFTIQQVTGEFFNSGEDFLFSGTVEEVTAINGTLNGAAITLAPPPHGGDGSWLTEGSFALGTVYFTVAGTTGPFSTSWLENDNLFNLVEIADTNGDGFGENVPINYSVTTPEPATLWLLAIACGCAILVKLRMRLRGVPLIVVKRQSWRGAAA